MRNFTPPPSLNFVQQKPYQSEKLTFKSTSVDYVKIKFLIIFMISVFSSNISTFGQLRDCAPTGVCFETAKLLYDPGDSTWTYHNYELNCCPLRYYSQPQNPPFCQLVELEACECIRNIYISGCLEGNITVKLYDKDSIFIRNLATNIQSDSLFNNGCMSIDVAGLYFVKVEFTIANQTTVYGWYTINVVNGTNNLNELNIQTPTEICLGQNLCTNISGANIEMDYQIFWNNVLKISSSITPPASSANYCFVPQSNGVGELKILVKSNCGDSVFYTRSVNVKSFTNFTYPNPVCVNQPFSINSITWCNGPISGATYVWNWGDGSANSYTQLPSHTYTNPGTYNITLTISNSTGSQTISKQIQVNSLPIKPTVSGNFNNCKLTNTYTITNAQAGTTYNWSATYCNSIPPGSASSKTITWFNNANFPDPPLRDSIRIISNNGCADTSYYRVWECCTKDGASTFSDTIFKNAFLNTTVMLNGIITIDSNITWSGKLINMGPEAKIVINAPYKLKIRISDVYAGCNYMWDGIYPITTGEIEIDTSTVSDAYNAIVSNNGAKYTLYGAILNKNLIGILVNSFSGTHPGLIRNSVFSSVDGYGNASNLINPYTSRRGIAGIKLNGVNAITIGNNLSTSYINTFKHLDYGIWINSSNATVYNNYFGPFPKTSGFIPDNGYGIYADKDGATANTINVGSLSINRYYSNTFQNCAVGIRAVHSFNLNVLRNTFNSNDYANFITDNYDRNVVCNTNTFTNNQVGIWCNNFAGTTQNILNNIMTNTTTGVYLSNNVATPIVEVEISGNNFSFLNGTSTYNLANGIVLSNVQGYNDFYLGEKKSHIYANTINFAGVDLTASTIRSGIRIENSPFCFIEKDTIKYNSSITSDATTNKLNGIYVVLSTNTELCSNVLQYLGNGVRIQGYCDNSKFKLNDFRRCNSSSLNYSYGFKFESATIGVQGDSTQTWDNKFNFNFLPGTPNRGVGSMALQQQWYFKNNNNVYLFRNPNENYSITNAIGRNISSIITCGFQDDFLMNGFNDINELSFDSDSEFLENDAENKYFKAYTILNSESSNESETILPSYISTSIDVENISKFSEVNRLVKDRLFESADSLNQLIEPANLIEKNMKTVNEIYLRTWAKGEYNLSLQDYTTLVDIAIQTPKTSGYGVIGAWVMVGRFDNTQDAEKFSNNKINIISNNIIMYPNPANSQLSFEGVEAVSTIIIHDIMGRIVRIIDNKHFENKITISINDLKNGIYIVSFTNEEGERLGFEKLTIN